MNESYPKTGEYRKERPVLENTLESLNDIDFARETAAAFFGMYASEVGNTAHLLTDEEVRDFSLFVKHVGKRVLNAHLQKFGGVNITEKVVAVGTLPSLPQQDAYSLFGTLFHDLSHSVGRIAKNNNATNLSPVQPYLKNKEDLTDFNNREFIEDELRGFMFGSFYYPSPIGNRSKMNLQEATTFEQFLNLYLKRALNAALSDSNNAVENHFYNKIPFEEYIDLCVKYRNEGEKIKDEILQNPPKDVVEDLTYLWEHKDEDRVLVDLFFKKIGPYIEELKKRKVYEL